MKAPVDILFPPVAPDRVPYWRLALRGCSQLCFQTNELTGLFFLAAVLVASPMAFAYFLVGALLAPGARMLLAERRSVLATGLAGLNPSLIAISLPAFFQTGWTDFAMWGVLIACVAFTVLLTRLCIAILPVPTLALPFLITFWIVWALEPHVDVLQPLASGSSGYEYYEHFATAVAVNLGGALFSLNIWSGALFLSGMLLSNWRVGLIALIGAIIGSLVTHYYSQINPASGDLGFYGFNGVLTAVSVYVVCGNKLRLAVLGTFLAMFVIPVIGVFDVQTLSAPFVFTTWLILGLGWIDEHWFNARIEARLAADPASEPPPARQGD